MQRAVQRLSRGALAAAAIWLACAWPAAAQQAAPAQAPAALPSAPPGGFPASHLTAARELVELTGFSRAFDAMLPEFAIRLRQSLAPSRPELLTDLDNTLVQVQPEINLRRELMLDRSARLFASQLTEAEVKELATFFKSNLGRRYLAAQPVIIESIQQSLQVWAQDTSEFLMLRVRQEMQRKGHTL